MLHENEIKNKLLDVTFKYLILNFTKDVNRKLHGKDNDILPNNPIEEQALQFYIKKKNIGKYKPTVPQIDLSAQNVIEKSVIKKPPTKKPKIEKNVVKKESVKKDSVKKPPTKKPKIEKNVVKKELVRKDSVKKLTTKKPVIKKNAIEKDSIKKPIIKKNVINNIKKLDPRILITKIVIDKKGRVVAG